MALTPQKIEYGGAEFQRSDKPHAVDNGKVLVYLTRSYRRNNEGEVAGFEPRLADALVNGNPGGAQPCGVYVKPVQPAPAPSAAPARGLK